MTLEQYQWAIATCRSRSFAIPQAREWLVQPTMLHLCCSGVTAAAFDCVRCASWQLINHVSGPDSALQHTTLPGLQTAATVQAFAIRCSAIRDAVLAHADCALDQTACCSLQRASPARRCCRSQLLCRYCYCSSPGISKGTVLHPAALQRSSALVKTLRSPYQTKACGQSVWPVAAEPSFCCLCAASCYPAALLATGDDPAGPLQTLLLLSASQL